MWRAVHVTTGDIVVFCDADVDQLRSRLRHSALVGPAPHARRRAASSRASTTDPSTAGLGEGGRVTELMARPLISLLFPASGRRSSSRWPASARPGGRCSRRCPSSAGYGVDLGLLIDVPTLRAGRPRPVRPRRAGAPQPSAVRAQRPGHGHLAARPGPGRASCETAAALGWTTDLVRPAAETGPRDAGGATPARPRCPPTARRRESPVQRSASTSATSSLIAPADPPMARSSPKTPTSVR